MMRTNEKRFVRKSQRLKKDVQRNCERRMMDRTGIKMSEWSERKMTGRSTRDPTSFVKSRESGCRISRFMAFSTMSFRSRERQRVAANMGTLKPSWATHSCVSWSLDASRMSFNSSSSVVIGSERHTHTAGGSGRANAIEIYERIIGLMGRGGWRRINSNRCRTQRRKRAQEFSGVLYVR